jgi:hypothetical protein
MNSGRFDILARLFASLQTRRTASPPGRVLTWRERPFMPRRPEE